MPLRPGGFTVLELVTAMAIIAILIALLVVGVDRVVASNKVKQTHIMLQNCRNLMAEMEVNNGLNQQPAAMYINGSAIQPSGTPPYDIWHYYDYSQVSAGEPTPPYYRALYANSQNNFGTGVVRGMPHRYDSDAVRNTRLAMAILQQVPNNKTALSSLPANQIMEQPTGLTPLYPAHVPTGPVILDGFGNPIILVPAAGIQVTITDPTNPSAVTTKIIRAPDNRPFWASAGPDGFFTDVNNQKPYGDDNIYSFEQ